MCSIRSVLLAQWISLLASFSCTVEAHGADLDTLYGVKVLGQQLMVRSLDLRNSLPVRENGRLLRQPHVRVNGLFQNKDRSIGVLHTSIEAESVRRSSVRIAGVPELITDVSTSEIYGLSSSEAISSVLIPISGSAIALVAHYSDTAPYSVALLDVREGELRAAKTFQLESHARFAHLTQCPNGIIYATSLAQQWDVQIVQLDLQARAARPLAELRIAGRHLRGDVADLACSGSGQLYVLADQTYSGINTLYRLDIATGEMTAIRQFDVDRMAFFR